MMVTHTSRKRVAWVRCGPVQVFIGLVAAAFVSMGADDAPAPTATTGTNATVPLVMSASPPALRDQASPVVPTPVTTNAAATNLTFGLSPTNQPEAGRATTARMRLEEPIVVADPNPTNSAVLKAMLDKLTAARTLRRQHLSKQAAPLLVSLLDDASPNSIKQSALLELALAAQDENDLSKAQQIFAQFLNRWPDDPRVPEILLSQGRLFRQMGLSNLALAKFYSVMTTALALKNDQLEYYQLLVSEAQSDIAETHYLAGKYTEAADFYARLLKHENSGLNRPLTQFRLMRSLYSVERYDQAAVQARDFLTRYPDAPEQPEVRFLLALSLKHLGRNSDSLQEVLTLLREQKARTQEQPEVWTYWQQRTGNEIANQLYREGDYLRALDVYLNLADLDTTPAWKVPVDYQIGLTYERLLQPENAMQTYARILSREPEVGTNMTPVLKAVFDMTRWRTNFIHWQNRAESFQHSLVRPAVPVEKPAVLAGSPPATPPTP